ncbi:FAD/NAD(P)-binding domain-containing protein [Vararia minispora EC-137]|uniref:FAD/NAD(P)-binding domain-containing protein n=1 Tax=Vararia minispora EC-137 TaxID=1314806 RepID=A0ACB8Q754_9AGAM|nr:FAD/NAD(P)-binding domain-containing protein [Vararia minispora EC-137]
MLALSRVLLLSAALFTSASAVTVQKHLEAPRHTKRIAVVGMGASGISALRAIMDLPEGLRAGWEVVAYEQRDDVGGIWLPQDNPPPPPGLPETPLYPMLRTNGAHPYQTLPHAPFPPETPLLAPHAAVLRYHQDALARAKLTSLVWLRHAVLRAEWVGDVREGFWELLVEDRARRRTFLKHVDHLIAAPGINRFPNYPDFDGVEDWLAAGKEIVHCVYFRDPRAFVGRHVVVVGAGPSGWDIVRHILPHAASVHWSRDTREDNPSSPKWDPIPGAPDRPRIMSLAGGVITFANGTTLARADVLLLATGYETRIPFLTAGGFLDELPRGAPRPEGVLSTTGRYVRPLFEHVLALDTRYPPGALYLHGLPMYNPTGLTTAAQGLFMAYTLAQPELLRSRVQMLRDLEEREERVRELGLDPERVGHKPTIGYGPLAGHLANGSYEDLLMHSLRDRGLAGYPGIPQLGANFTEQWRLYVMSTGTDVLFAWNAGELTEGVERWNERWTKGRVTEKDYVKAVKGVIEWWKEGKRRTGKGDQRSADVWGWF